METSKSPYKKGFTLVELLVVIVIIASLASVVFTMTTKAMRAAKATRAIENMRQIAPLLANYASDHSMKLPPAENKNHSLPDGSTVEIRWSEVCLEQLYPGTDFERFQEKVWWEQNKPILRNPLFKESATPRGWEPRNPGYAFNLMISENLAILRDGASLAQDELLATSVSLASIAEPERTPMIAPCDNFFYRYDENQLEEFEDEETSLFGLLSDGKIPILFVDGHLESLTPKEYLTRELFMLPR